ncbi:ATP-binding protein [Acidithiobacillus sp.]|uniref:hybrid sensor histidine kinase/response regulator n=1 Tax=Acidithiobacillus sp. TaxID=1872118 RepID=UPI0025BB6FB0|nr:ATP-binding protein [Acidithiobacillus sp.]
MDDHRQFEVENGQAKSLWYAHAMEQLVEVVQKLSLARDLGTIMDIVRHAARSITGADGATFVLRDGDKCFYAEEDAISPLWKGQRFPMSACISGWAMLNRQAAVIEDIYADPRIPADAYRPTFVKSLAMVPIRTIDPVGAIGNYWGVHHHPTPEQVKLLQALADTTAVAMENVRIYSELEQRVQQRTSELQAILDNVQVGIAFVVNDRMAQVNPKAVEIFGYSTPQDMQGISLQEILVGQDQSSLPSELAKTSLAGGNVFNIETKLLRRNGAEFWSHLMAKSVDGSAQSNRNIWVIDDISEAKSKEKLLDDLRVTAELANRAKDSFLATMSHEIRTPLTGMLGMLELLSLTSLDGEQRETLEAAWDSGRGLLRIVSDILDWSKIEEGKLELAPRPTSIEQLLKDIVNAYSRVASAQSLVLWQHADSRLNSAYIVDALRLSQVLNNFVSNAIKFTKAGEIEVRAELVEHLDSGDRIRFSVKDTGVGIAREVQDRLFQRYRQGSADTARIYGGTGLGLSICKRLADLMDGQVGLESEPGHGAVFSLTLTLPISGLPGETVKNMYPEVKQREVQPLFVDSANAPMVLAVDDHPINRDLLARQIRLLGLRTETAENGKVALDMWQKGGYAMIITDCHMPEMDGYALAREVRKMEASAPLPRTPVVAWTANALAEESNRCRGSGIDDLLVKPADMKQLRSVLAKWLDIPAAGGKEAGALFDLKVLGMIVSDEASQLQVLHDFLRHIQADNGKLPGLFETGSLEDIESIAHKMKGASRMVGATNIAEACEAMESAAKAGDLAQANSARSGLEDAISRAASFITSGRKL